MTEDLNLLCKICYNIKQEQKNAVKKACSLETHQHAGLCKILVLSPRTYPEEINIIYKTIKAASGITTL